MIRLANINDAQQLFALNEAFNGKDETSLRRIKQSISDNLQEIVVVAQEGNVLVGFVCVQVKQSFCYSDVYAEITEAYVSKPYRRQKIASKMIKFAEEYCVQHYPLHNFEILTGKNNFKAKSLYKSLGYSIKKEVFLSKKV